MKLRIFQKGFNFSQDGPGNRLVIHLQGCNLHCPWCSNPESMAVFGGEEIETEALFNEIIRCEPMFFEGGGITLTGGEPTVQLDAVKELLSLLKDRNINTAIETNGTSPRLPELFEYVDFLIADFKHHSPKKFADTVGGSLETVKKNLLSAGEKRQQLLIRIPLIGGFNSSADDAKEMAAFLSQLPEFVNVEILRYHEYGKDKWAKCGKEYTMKNAFVSDEEYISFRNTLTASGINLVRT